MNGWVIFLQIANIFVIIVVGLVLKSYLPEYFKTKGKNLATKEDIEEITERTEKALQRQRRKDEKLKRVEEYLNQFARLIELYRFMARGEGHLETDDGGKQIWKETWLEPEPDLAEAFESMEGISIRVAIKQTEATIRLMSGKVSDLVLEFDESGNLNRKFVELYGEINSNVKHSIKHKEFKSLVTSLDSASRIRRDIFSELIGYYNDI